MTDCPLERIADPWWLCPQCGWLYYGERKPRRNCPEAPSAKGRLLTEIDAILALFETDATNAEIDRLAQSLMRKPCGCGETDLAADPTLMLQSAEPSHGGAYDTYREGGDRPLD